MDFTQYVVLGAILVGVNELIKRLRAQDWWVAGTIAICAVIGAAFGFYHWTGVPDPFVGLLAGFGASGALATLGSIGNKSAAAPSGLIRKSE